MKLQILLRPQYRNAEGIATVKAVAQSLGMVPTAQGAATLSAEADADTFEALFGTQANASLFNNPSTSQTLPVPEALKEHVESISVAPRHVYM